ncbi:ABC transporter permease [Gulosibacter chungangensis]|uniref:FtsX-like permease family protein n=1 Tax=Gulosibacter chungangensis TaxID=979746 RepID=A0A7J5B942_9MICO|nr:FtsX-like permease family protein [Gulosibacter chungangensis]KAB1641909.1 FtsX-like permease family protein [Gulosibacter chungangensis]
MSATLSLATKQIRRSPRRVLAILLAALLSSMAITATGTFITSLNQSLQNELAAPTSHADVVISAPDEDTFSAVEANSAVTAAEQLYTGYASATVGQRDVWFDVQVVPETESLRWSTLTKGAWPSTGEIVLTQKTLETLELSLGDSLAVTIMSGDEPSERKFTISGIVELEPGAEGTTSAMYIAAADAPEIALPAEIIVQTVDGTNATAFASELNNTFGDAEEAPHAYTTAQYVAMLVDSLAGGTDLLATLFLIFVVIALLAAAMVIRNTFQVLLAQRMRENGLLRLVGAGGAQVQRTVLAEAMLLGLFGGAAGLLVGLALGWAVGRLAGITTVGVPIAWGWMLAALLVTLLLTVISAWAPARSASRLTPMAALTASATTEETVARRRVGAWVIGGILTVIGTVGAVTSALVTNFLLLVPSGIVLAIGLIVLVPLLVTVIMPLIARSTSRAGAVTKLAGENLVRTSRRTGTVVLAIALGGSLVIGMLTALQSASNSMQTMLTENYPVDLVLASEDGSELPSEVLATLEESSATSAVATVRSVPIELSGDVIPIRTAVGVPNEWNGVQVDSVSNNEILVPTWLVADPEEIDGTRVEIAAANGETLTLTVRTSPLADAIQNSMGFESFGVVSENTIKKLNSVGSPNYAWVIAMDGDSATLMSEVSELQTTYPSLDAYGALTTVQMFEQIFAMVATFVIGMLGLTIVISAIGLASVVALAVAERGREIALLRALGLTRNKTRRMVLFESVSLAGLGAAFSLIIGIPLGIAAVYSALGSESVVISLPWLGIAAVIITAAVLGIIAGLGPAQRATRIAPAQGLATD